jgi:ribose transport system ATP-binding protein
MPRGRPTTKRCLRTDPLRRRRCHGSRAANCGGCRWSATDRSLIQRFAVKVANPNRPVRLLSGGNQQKVVIAKWLGIEPDVLIMDEPTAGVDIGTKSEILDMIRGLADDGKGIILISSELPELLAVSDRVLVLRDGSVAQELSRRDIPDEESLQLAVQGV